MSPVPVLIFSGYNDRAIIAFCRYAVQRKIIFYIVAKGPEDYIHQTVYKGNVIFDRKEIELELLDIINICNKVKKENDYNEILILPSTEYLNRILVKHQIILKKNFINVGLCKSHIYQLISDKLSFGELCSSNSIAVPQNIDEESVTFPIVIKPKKYFSKDNKIYKPALIYSEEDFQKFFKHKSRADFYLQEFIGGKSFYLLYYFFKDGTYSFYGQQNHIQENNGGSIILAKSILFNDEELVSKFSTLFKKIKFNGLVMVEVKYFKGNYYMIEANPRLWGPSQLINDSKMDLFECFAFDNGLISQQLQYNFLPNKWYFWSSRINTKTLNKDSIVYHDFNQMEFLKYINEIESIEIYNKEDTCRIYKKNK